MRERSCLRKCREERSCRSLGGNFQKLAKRSQSGVLLRASLDSGFQSVLFTDNRGQLVVLRREKWPSTAFLNTPSVLQTGLQSAEFQHYDIPVAGCTADLGQKWTVHLNRKRQTCAMIGTRMLWSIITQWLSRHCGSTGGKVDSESEPVERVRHALGNRQNTRAPAPITRPVRPVHIHRGSGEFHH